MPAMHMGSPTEHQHHLAINDASWRTRQLATVAVASVLCRVRVAQVLPDEAHGSWLVFDPERSLTKSEVAALSIGAILGEEFGPRAEAVDFGTEGSSSRGLRHPRPRQAITRHPQHREPETCFQPEFGDAGRWFCRRGPQPSDRPRSVSSDVRESSHRGEPRSLPRLDVRQPCPPAIPNGSGVRDGDGSLIDGRGSACEIWTSRPNQRHRCRRPARD